MDYEKKVEILNPPYKFTTGGKDYYLTANLYFMRDQWTKDKIKKECLRFLKPYFEGIPKLRKMKLCVDIHSNKTTFDLDNKAYFWRKIVLDLLKTPTQKQLHNALKKRKEIISVNVLPDDTVLYIDDERARYFRGGSKLVFHIQGQLLDPQQKLL